MGLISDFLPPAMGPDFGLAASKQKSLAASAAMTFWGRKSVAAWAAKGGSKSLAAWAAKGGSKNLAAWAAKGVLTIY